MPKAIVHPTDVRLLDKSRQHLVKLAKDHHIALRQSYNRKRRDWRCKWGAMHMLSSTRECAPL